MDLGFTRLIAASATPLGVAMPVDLTVLLIGVGERQEGSATAQAQVAMPPKPVVNVRFTAAGGAFCPKTAALLRQWKGP